MLNNKKKIYTILTVCLMIVFLLPGCAKAKDADFKNVAQTEAVIQFTDDDGRVISLDEPCSRIISLYSAHTENLFELGAGDLIILPLYLLLIHLYRKHKKFQYMTLQMTLKK